LKHRDAPAFDFYPERFWFAVEGWNDTEICRYWRLLGQQWIRDGLPADIKELEGLARGKVSQRVLEKFPLVSETQRKNLFLENVRASQRERIESRRKGAQKTNAQRWGKVSLSDTVSERSATIQRSLSESPPPTTHHPPPTPLGDGWMDGLTDEEQKLLSAMGAECERRMWPKEWSDEFVHEYGGRGWKNHSGNPISAPVKYFVSWGIKKKDKLDAKAVAKREKEQEALPSNPTLTPENTGNITPFRMPTLAEQEAFDRELEVQNAIG